MKIGMILGGLTAASLAVTLGQFNATALPGDGGSTESAGPDVIVGGIPAAQVYGAVGGISAYSFATTSCNVGTQNLSWIQNTNVHPVIPQNVYRVKNGVIEQIGMSWLKHGFCALQQTLCGACTPAGGGCANALGVGCSDPYDASLNGQQSLLGPRYQVNASTGWFLYPVSGVPAAPATIGRRCQVATNDMNPALNAGASYFVECMYIHPQDAAAGNDNNNASYRAMNVSNSTTSGAYQVSLTGATVQMKCALYAWKAVVPAVQVVELETADGRLVVAYNVTDNGNGTWHYEYAVFNMNSDASVGSVSIPVPPSVAVTNQGFRDVAYHSGEPYSGTDWAMASGSGAATWATDTFATNSNANALRWGTTYNFRFDAAAPPTNGTVTLGRFKTGDSIGFSGLVPGMPAIVGDLNGDGSVDGADLGILLSEWGAAGGIADLNGDLFVDGGDLGILLTNWG
ncbi:MAG: hypothetical protein JNK53_01420 [Phycisphaerae bacterium]|nr:hypothetical protein [Phycisphaerae bacterium]